MTDRLCALGTLAVIFLLPIETHAQDQFKVGLQPDGRIVVPTNQVLKPAGMQITFPGRPVSLLLIDDGKTLVVQDRNNLLFIDVKTRKILQTLASPVGLSVIGLAGNTERVFTSDVKDQVHIAEKQRDGAYKWGKPIELTKPNVDGAAHPAGMALRNDKELWVTSTRGNNVQQIDLANGKVKQIVPVGVAPFAIVFPRSDRAYVSNWGGDHPKQGDPQALSSATPVKIDPRTRLANHGSVSVLALVDGQWTQVKTIPTGLHPCGMIASKSGRFVYVANANSDTVSVIDTAADQVVETINCLPENRLPFGSGCNAVALHPAGHILYVANGSNNCVAVVSLTAASAETQLQLGREPSSVVGLIPTGWYPGAVQISADAKQIFVANIKGHGSLDEKRAKEKGRNSHDHLGSVSVIDLPDANQLAKYTAEVNSNNRLAYSLNGLDKPRADAKPMPIPERHREPSVFEHVLYIIKENRTYDQVFGDIKEGNGDPNLVMFGEKERRQQGENRRQAEHGKPESVHSSELPRLSPEDAGRLPGQVILGRV